MPYVQREDGNIVGVFANFQEWFAEEEIQDTAPELIAFLEPAGDNQCLLSPVQTAAFGGPGRWSAWVELI